MRDLKLVNNSNTLQISNFDLLLTDSTNFLDYVSQKLRTVLMAVKGEWFLDTDVGLPYFESILVKSPNISYIEDLYKQAILSVDEVTELVSFALQFEPTTRQMQADFKVTIISGETLTLTV